MYSSKAKSLADKALKQIRGMKVESDLQIPIVPFAKLVNEILQQERSPGSVDYQVQKDALIALAEAAESTLVRLFESMNDYSVDCYKLSDVDP